MPRLTEEQRAERMNYIGASDIAAIAGLNPYRDAFDVLNEKLGFAEERPDEEDRADVGHELEPVIRKLYMRDQNVSLIPCGTVRHPTETWAGCTLDSKIQGMRRGLECKAVGHRVVYDWDPHEPDGVPHYVRCQAAWQMWVVDLDEVDVAALLGGPHFKIFRCARDLELESHLRLMGHTFHVENLIERKSPPFTAGDGVRAYLNGKYPPPPEPVQVPADETITAALMAREAASRVREESDSVVRKSTADAIAWLGERKATDVIGDGWEFRCRVRKDGKRAPWFKRKDG
jgi:putative phage-type endonuclease